MDKEIDQHDEADLEVTELEPTDDEGGESRLEDKLKKLRAKLKECEAQKRDHMEELQRAKADFLNVRKRLAEQQQAEIERREDGFVRALLPLADSFAMAMKDTEAWEAIDGSWRKGVEGIHQQLQRILTDHGVVAIDPTGETFDPNRHEAVGTTDAKGESEQVVEVMQVGYERNGIILRPAKVIISS